ncbi:YigZ family protein [Devosia sp. MC1541]|uniref:IMPACT family protein n=1 Tax=Devosia sp. MC1541 TaxID=2725264 RepID=UPI00145F5466|nr:YigZ family protein [Devosia sp. MC1541]
MTDRFTLINTATFRQDIKKSCFIALAAPIASEADAKQFLTESAATDAGHNCWAWRLGQAYRFSDDGEPSGTAGKPILQAIDGQNLDGVVVNVSRWFGGVLLGSGGLIRAYGGTAAQCLRNAEKAQLIAMSTVKITVPFEDVAPLQARIPTFPYASISAQDFTATGANLTIAVARDAAEELRAYAINSTRGRALVFAQDES